MKNIYTWSAKPTQRNLTVADLKSFKGKKNLLKLEQIHLMKPLQQKKLVLI